MNEFKSALRAYDLGAAVSADCGDNCIVLDLASCDTDQPVPSLHRLLQAISTYENHDQDPITLIRKLYIIGDWTLASGAVGEARCDDDTDADAQSAKTKEVPELAEWREAELRVKEFLKSMEHLEELTYVGSLIPMTFCTDMFRWICGLPFTADICEALPEFLTKLVVDLGEPVRIDNDGDIVYRSYITPQEMKPLQQQTKLKELRLFHVHNSLQQIVWETVFRNTSEGGMRVLDLQMASAPIVRLEKWRKAKDVRGLTVPTGEGQEKEYKGLDGKGILHYAIGTGEYLDGFCIRKARIASGLVEATPLPLWCLKLDGFVLDYLPFEHELSRLVLLTCGEDCIDSGLRAPKTRRAAINLWSSTVNNAASHCLIQWPNWIGIFDNEGSQRDSLGQVVAQEVGLSTPLNSPSIIQLTEMAQRQTEAEGSAGNTIAQDYFSVSPPLSGFEAGQSCPDNVSVMSTRGGSEVPSPTASSLVCSPQFPIEDESLTTISNQVSDLSISVDDEHGSAQRPASDDMIETANRHDSDNTTSGFVLDGSVSPNIKASTF